MKFLKFTVIFLLVLYLLAVVVSKFIDPIYTVYIYFIFLSYLVISAIIILFKKFKTSRESGDNNFIKIIISVVLGAGIWFAQIFLNIPRGINEILAAMLLPFIYAIIIYIIIHFLFSKKNKNQMDEQ